MKKYKIIKLRLDRERFVIASDLSNEEASVAYSALEALEMSEGNFLSRVPKARRFWTQDGSEIWVENDA